VRRNLVLDVLDVVVDAARGERALRVTRFTWPSFTGDRLGRSVVPETRIEPREGKPCSHLLSTECQRPGGVHEPTVTEPGPALRALLVDAADNERRRIERALHDGVQQDLIAVSVRLQLARRLAGTDHPEVIALLDEVGRDVRDALERVRALADEIYPSLLEGRGIAEALSGAASATGVSVAVEAGELGRYPEAVEAAVYFCCRAVLEAVAASGTDTRVTARIREEERALSLAVEFGSTAGEAALETLAPARERVEVLGGAVSLTPAGNRMRLLATVPRA
jgi:signal transduction histidine kinase